MSSARPRSQVRSRTSSSDRTVCSVRARSRRRRPPCRPPRRSRASPRCSGPVSTGARVLQRRGAESPRRGDAAAHDTGAQHRVGWIVWGLGAGTIRTVFAPIHRHGGERSAAKDDLWRSPRTGRGRRRAILGGRKDSHARSEHEDHAAAEQHGHHHRHESAIPGCASAPVNAAANRTPVGSRRSVPRTRARRPNLPRYRQAGGALGQQELRETRRVEHGGQQNGERLW